MWVNFCDYSNICVRITSSAHYNPSLTVLRWSVRTISDGSGEAASDCSRGSEVRSAQHSICAQVMARSSVNKTLAWQEASIIHNSLLFIHPSIHSYVCMCINSVYSSVCLSVFWSALNCALRNSIAECAGILIPSVVLAEVLHCRAIISLSSLAWVS